MKVRDICSRYVVAAEPDTDLRTAAQLMRSNHVGALVVINHTLAEAIEHANARERKERRALENAQRVA